MSNKSSALDVIAADPPDFEPEQVLAVLERDYGLRGTLSQLVSERDQNFRFETADGQRFVVKIANSAEPFDITDFQVQALRHLEERGCAVAVPLVVTTRRDEVMTTIGAGADRHRLRVVSYVPGLPLEGRSPDRALTFDMGRGLAQIDLALQGFTHPGGSQLLLWDMQRAAELRPLVKHVPDAVNALVGDCIDIFEERVAPQFGGLRTQVIHNDLNPGNVLVTDSEPAVLAGVIDFGDMLRAPLVIDVAIAASYLRATDDNLEALRAFVAGFESQLPLDGDERSLLYDLIRTRLAATITILYWRVAIRPANDPYLKKALEERSSERFLRHLSQLGRARFGEALFNPKN
jgi:Ser/Thr protein kinase RdoA (MazF antagonist)